jgi:hypothetical protein
MNKEAGPTNPMLYDPIPEGSVQTSKKMQFVAAVAGEIAFGIVRKHWENSGKMREI